MKRKRTGNRQRPNKGIGYIAMVLSAMVLAIGRIGAQEARIEVRGPSRVSVGQTFQITFEVNAEAKNFKGPTFSGLSILAGPNKGSSSSIQIINGNVSRSVSNSFTYVLRAESEGVVNIGAASCTAGGKTIQSHAVTLEVVKGDPGRQPNTGGSGQGNGRQIGVAQAKEISDKTLFARATISKNNLYQGEEAIIVYKIYTQVPITQFQIEKLPRNKGFWSEDLSENMTEVPQYEETYNGQRYQVAEIRRGAIYAQENGVLSIAPLKTDVLAIVQNQVQRQRTGDPFIDFFINDPFINPIQQQTVVKTLTSNSINVNVKPLPAAPANYYGGVGTYEVKANADITEMKSNEAFTYRVTVSGRGNLSLLETPTLNFPTGLEVYEPRVEDKINKGDHGLSGSRTYEWVIIPQAAGDYEIPELEYVFFDPTSGQYVTRKCDAISIKVSKGKASSGSKSDVTELNSDIHHIKKSTHLRKSEENEKTGAVFWILMLLPAVIGGGIAIYIRKRQAMAEDESAVKYQRATKLAKKRLRNAERYLHEGDDNRFYEEIYTALWGCIADKFDILQSTLSSETVLRHLEERNVDEGLKERIMQTLHDVDYARFAPGESGSKKKTIYDEAMETIMHIGGIKNQKK